MSWRSPNTENCSDLSRTGDPSRKTSFASCSQECSKVATPYLAVEGIHKSHIYHRDVKSENVLLDQHFRAKLCDFGSSIESKAAADAQWQRRLLSGANQRDIFGTQAYNAPEVHTGADNRSFDKCDVFSLGCLLFLLVDSSDQTFRQHPFKQAKRDDPMFRLLHSANKDQYWAIFSKFSASDDLKGTPESARPASSIVEPRP